MTATSYFPNEQKIAIDSISITKDTVMMMIVMMMMMMMMMMIMIIIIIIIILNNEPDIKIRDNEKGRYMSIDVAISGDRNVIKKEAEKILKYKDLTIEIQHM